MMVGILDLFSGMYAVLQYTIQVWYSSGKNVILILLNVGTRLVLLLLATGDSGFVVCWREASSPQLV